MQFVYEITILGLKIKWLFLESLYGKTIENIFPKLQITKQKSPSFPMEGFQKK